MYHWFDDDEVVGLDAKFVQRLDEARGISGVPFIITSGFRTPTQNSTAGGVQDSAHLQGLAVDLRVRDHHTRCIIVRALYAQGFSRIGIYRDIYGLPTHVHVDASTTLPQEELFDGTSH